jgi:flagellar protein FlhE
MKLKKWLYLNIFAISAIFMVAQNANAASAAYGSSTVAPTIYSKNWWYNSTYPVVGNPPSTGKIGLVYYSYNYSPRPAGLQVYLCKSTGYTCADITNFGSGSVDFTSANVPPNQALGIFVRVNGTGTMTPVYGSTTNITVNYTY